MGLLINGQVGWRTAAVIGAPAAASSLWTSVYGVWNADTLGTSLDTNIFRVYNGDNVNDTSGNAQNGTNVGGVTFTTGKIGNAFTFNGSNYISLPDNSLNLSGQISISLWWYVDPTNDQCFIGNRQRNGSSINHGWQFKYNSGGFIFRVMNLTTDTEWGASSSLPIGSTGTWIHVVAVKNSSSDFKLYVNNVQHNMINGVPAEPAYLSNQKCTIGNVWAGSGFDSYMKSGSKIDGLTIWNKALTANEVASLYNTGTGAEYPFSSQTLPSPNDAVSTNHGTLMNGCTFATGKIGKAFTFDGINDYVALPNNSLNSLTSDFSVSGWIYMPANTSNSYCVLLSNVSNDYTTGKGWNVFTYGNNIYFDVYYSGVYQSPNSAYVRLQVNNTLNNNAWNHVTITRKNSTSSKIYINGSLVGSNTSTQNPATPTSAITPTIGVLSSVGVGNPLSSYAPNGTKIDGLSVWNRELTSADVTELYNAGAGKQYPTT